jgi:hypothetical protein
LCTSVPIKISVLGGMRVSLLLFKGSIIRLLIIKSNCDVLNPLLRLQNIVYTVIEFIKTLTGFIYTLSDEILSLVFFLLMPITIDTDMNQQLCSTRGNKINLNNT